MLFLLACLMKWYHIHCTPPIFLATSNSLSLSLSLSLRMYFSLYSKTYSLDVLQQRPLPDNIDVDPGKLEEYLNDEEFPVSYICVCV